MKLIAFVVQGLILICLLALIVIYTSVKNEDGTVLNSSTKLRSNTSKDVSKSVHSQETNILSSPDFDSPDFQDLLNGPIYLAADDPQLIRYVRNHILFPPSTLPYNLSNPHVKDPSAGQTKRALAILNNMEFGYFVEAGGLTGERLSNSIYLERFLGWTGLIVEPDPINFKELLTKNRKAWLANVCLSLQPYPVKVTFNQAYSVGKISSNNNKGKLTKNQVVVQCIPLLTLLLAVNQTKIDYFSLDVEGAELDVLRTIPYKQVDIKLWSVEVDHVLGGAAAVERYMKGQGYKVHSKVYGTYAGDLMLIKK